MLAGGFITLVSGQGMLPGIAFFVAGAVLTGLALLASWIEALQAAHEEKLRMHWKYHAEQIGGMTSAISEQTAAIKTLNSNIANLLSIIQ